MDKFFKISERGSNVRTEIIAGLTTFFAMAYIVITNPNQITSFSTDGPMGKIWNAVCVASTITIFPFFSIMHPGAVPQELGRTIELFSGIIACFILDFTITRFILAK